MWQILFKRRPRPGDQGTGQEAIQPFMGLRLAPYNGGAGFTYKRTMNATAPAGIVPGPTYKLVDPTVTGNNSGTLGTVQLERDTATSLASI